MQKRHPAAKRHRRGKGAPQKMSRESASPAPRRRQTARNSQPADPLLIAFIESTEILMVVVEEDETIGCASRGFLRLSGYTQEEILHKKRWTELIVLGDEKENPVDRPLDFATPDSARTGRFGRVVRKDKSARHVLVTWDRLPPTGRFVLSLMDMTERKQAEETLRQREEKYRNILEGIEDGYYETDLQGNLTFFNDALCRLPGYSREELMGANYRQFIHPVYAAEVFTAFNTVFKTGRPARGFSWVILCKDGSERYVETSVSLKKDASGAPTGFFGINRDITERKRMEAELTRARDFIENVEDGCIEMDLQGNVTFCNSAFLKQTGYTIEEYNALTHWGRQPSSEEGQRIFDIYHQVHRTGVPAKSVEHKILHKDGSVKIWDVSISLIRDKSGKPVGFRGIGRDVTEHKRMEETLRRSEERYRTILDEMADGYFEVDLGGHYTFVNDANCRLLGYPREELIGTSFRRQVVEEDIPLVYEIFNRIYTTGNPVRGFTYRAVHKDGSIGIGEIAAFPLRDEKGNIVGFRGIAQNITDRVRAEEEKKKLQAQLLQAQKMESVGRLAGGVAHDFNNMLNVILGRTEMAMHQADLAPSLQTHLLEIRKAAERSANMTRQLLAFARKQTIAPKVLDLNETVEATLRMLRQLMGEDIHLVWLPGTNLWPVKIDPSQVDQILANLCVNARDAITGVGTVTIETANVSVDGDYSRRHVDCVPGDYVMLAVSDNGCGMSREILDKLFEPYFTTKGVGKGTGLGLATIYGIIKQNDGFINVYSEPNQGTTFRIYLKRHTGQSGAETEKEPPKRLYEGSETLLIVEDEPSILSLCRIVLEGYGYRVMTACTPGEALRLAEAYRGNIDLLITDVVMPEMNGRDLALKLLALCPNIKRLFMSGYPANVIARHGVLDEDVDFIQKPFSGKELAEKVRSALDRKS